MGWAGGGCRRVQLVEIVRGLVWRRLSEKGWAGGGCRRVVLVEGLAGGGC